MKLHSPLVAPIGSQLQDKHPELIFVNPGAHCSQRRPLKCERQGHCPSGESGLKN